MWHRRVWRQIDLREKINHPLYYPIQEIEDRKSLFDVIRIGISEGTLTAYDEVSDEFEMPLTKAEVDKLLKRPEVKLQYDEYGDVMEGFADTAWVDYTSQDIVAFRLKEDWFFDNERSIMDVRIMGICPVRLELDENLNVKGQVPMFWIYFPEARYVLRTTMCLTDKMMLNVERMKTYSGKECLTATLSSVQMFTIEIIKTI